ncbi:MFS transporter [Clostridium estertheticum]|uniref:MFS transporter n=1 Tax=Clostridium estertheticum TaxID=238834 RepID=UPI001C6F23AA|nr:MFS transporter [Clostridium estertheticum]MBW9154386.1 MFS transporter [Clostridium estertheticum]WLC85833.1 MFS transporter [Clostridium estertheticum]
MGLKRKMYLLFGKNKWILYIIGLFIGIAMGIINPLASTHLEQINVGSFWIGIVSSSFFLFMSIGSAYLDKNMRNKNIKGIILVGSLVSATACGIFPFVSSLYVLFLLMVIMGFGISFNIVGVQTMLQNLTEDDTRGMVSGLYSFYFAIGFVLSSIIGPKLYMYKTWFPFMIPIVALLLCPVIVKLNFKEKLIFPAKLKENVLKKITIGLQGAFLYGFTETTLITLYPIFLLHKHYSLTNLGYALAIFVVGSIVGTMPMTYISDKVGHNKTLIIIIFISIFTVLGIIVSNSFELRLIFSFLSGFVIGPIYPLSLAVTVQNLGSKEISSGTSLFTSSYGIGSTIGPIVSSTAMSLFGDGYIFSVCLLIFVIFLFTTFVKRSNDDSKTVV